MTYGLEGAGGGQYRVCTLDYQHPEFKFAGIKSQASVEIKGKMSFTIRETPALLF